jgi:hypothetical protein
MAFYFREGQKKGRKVMTQLTIRVLCALKNPDGKENGHRKSIESFVKMAIVRYRSELDEKGETAVEWKIVENAKRTDEAFLLVGTPTSLLSAFRDFGDESRSCVAVLPDNQWDKDLNNLLQSPKSDVLAVIRGKNALGDGKEIREEDVLRLSEILKSLARRYLRAREGISEENLSKSIEWKCKIPEDTVDSSSFISFFSDPMMSKMGRELKEALLSLDIDTRAKDREKPENIDNRELNKVYSVLLLGETGTGKTLAAEWIARQLFPESWREAEVDSKKSSPMVALNTASLSENMVDVELFGSVPGAFTDADKEVRKGILQTYAGKVIFLDEIGEMELASQARLLKYLDSGEVRHVGGTDTSKVFSIIVAATNRPWDQWVQMENPPFHADLFYRFDHVVKIPSLKERKKDMRLLISILLQDTNINGKIDGEYRVKRIGIDAIEFLENASYPGNFRDLRGRIRAAVSRAVSEGASTLCLRHLMLI